MEKSIKRVEKLVHATSSTLAQMKFSLMFDDMNKGKKSHVGRRVEGLDAALLEKFLESDDLNQRQNEFKLEATETLARMDKILANENESGGKNMKPIDRIKEINKKMNHLKLEQSKRGETKQSRQKLLSLISEEKFSPGTTSYKGSVTGKQTGRFNEGKEPSEKSCSVPESVLTSKKSPMKSKADLKERILETQEIVDRGFQTAKQLAQKVENIAKGDKKDTTPSSVKTVSEINLRSLEGKTESNETLKTVKCRRCSGKKKPRETNLVEGEQINNRVIDIKRNEYKRNAKIHLQLQRLPSLHIRGGLKVQKVHSLEIPASEEVSLEKINTAISFLSHEQMEKEKMEKILEKIKKENCVCVENEKRANYVECFNCGKVIKIRETWMDPRGIDEVLRKCDFNVFDPRIDEFVEKYRGADVTDVICGETIPAVPSHSDPVLPPKLEVLPKNTHEIIQTKSRREPKRKKRFTLRDLSDQLCKKYKEEAEALTDNHLKLDAILRNLFRKVEESKEVFERCHLLSNDKSDSERGPALTATKPVLVNLPGASLFARNKQRKLDKKDVKNRSKSRTLDDKEILVPEVATFKSPRSEDGEKTGGVPQSNRDKRLGPESKEIQKRIFPSTIWESGSKKLPEITKEEDEELLLVSSASSHSGSNYFKPDSGFRREKIKKTLMMASLQRKNSKLLEDKSFVELSPSKSKTPEPLDDKIEEIEELSSSASSASFTKGRAASETNSAIKNNWKSKYFSPSSAQIDSIKPIFRDSEGMSPSKSPNADEDENAGPRQTPSEKSENNYESDFESFTNELEEKGDDYEEEKQELNIVLKKLSTISEVNSEQEKKLTDDQRTLSEDKSVKLISQKEENSAAMGVTAKSKKTDLTPPRTAEGSLKSTPTELVTSLRDILSALQDQFARTESLAEKLTESSKVERMEKQDSIMAPIADVILNPWNITNPVQLVENLQSSRKDRSSKPKENFSLALGEKPTSGRNKIPEEILSEDSESEEGGSSLGEIIVSDRRKNSCSVFNTSSISEESFLNLCSENKSPSVLSSRKKMTGISSSNFVT